MSEDQEVHCETTQHDFRVAGSVSQEDGSPHVLINSEVWALAMTPLQAYDLAAELMREAKKIEVQVRMYDHLAKPGLSQEGEEALLSKIHDMTCDCDDVAPPEFSMEVHRHVHGDDQEAGGPK